MKIKIKDLDYKISVFKIALHTYLVRTNRYDEFYHLTYQKIKQISKDVLNTELLDALNNISEEEFAQIAYIFEV